MLAAKAAIGLRVDALSDWSAQGEGKGDDIDDEERSALGVTSRMKIERHLRSLEGKPLLPRGVAVGPNGTAVTPGKWEVKEAQKYNADADGLAGDEPASAAPVSEKKSKKDKKEKKEKKSKKPLIEEVVAEPDSDEEMAGVDAGLALPPPDLNGTKAKPVAQNSKKDESEDEDSDDERRARKLEKAAKKAEKKAKKEVAPAEVEDPDIKLAEAAGLSLKKYKKKVPQSRRRRRKKRAHLSAVRSGKPTMSKSRSRRRRKRRRARTDCSVVVKLT